jgi:hypothetical protein
MTWGEFKAFVEARGVVDADEVEYIDFNWKPYEVEFDNDVEPRRFSVS